ncbi:MAG: helix-turn-helix domain-containing protein [Chitinophagaceae bacterium]|nr:helix-turn-helix domain-containing protein [Chitinophagaceae bacterium]
MENERHIYNRLKSWLALKQIKNKALAEHLNVSEQTVSKWCTNYSQPSIPDLYRIAEFLNVEVSDLLEPLKKK